MSLGSTAQGKQLLLLRQDGRTATQTFTGQSTTMTAGSLISIDTGPTLSSPLGLCRKLVDVVLKATVSNKNATPANWIQPGPLVALFSTFNVYLNNELTFCLPSTSGDDNAWNVLKHSYTDVCGADSLADAYAEDDIGIVPNPPDAAIALALITVPMGCCPSIAGGASVSKSQSLARHLLPDLLSHLPIGPVKSLRVELGFPSTFNEAGKQRLGVYDVSTIDADIELTGVQIQLTYLDTPIAASPKIAPSLKLTWPRWEAKRYSLPFTPGVASVEQTYTVNLTTDFSHTSAIDRVSFWFAPAMNNPIPNHAYPLTTLGHQCSEVSGLVVKENGQEIHNFTRAELVRHMSRSHQFKTGHHIHPGPSSAAFGTQSGLWFSMHNLTKPLLRKGGAVSSKLLGGRSNKASTISMDIKMLPSDDNTLTSTDLIVSLVRDVVGELCSSRTLLDQSVSISRITQRSVLLKLISSPLARQMDTDRLSIENGSLSTTSHE